MDNKKKLTEEDLEQVTGGHGGLLKNLGEVLMGNPSGQGAVPVPGTMDLSGNVTVSGNGIQMSLTSNGIDPDPVSGNGIKK